MNTKESTAKKVVPFCCEKCYYTTSRKSQYDRHIVTSKHLKLISEVEKTYECSCGKSYSHMSSLCAHKKKCTIINQEEAAIKELKEKEKDGVALKMTDIQNAIPNMDMSLIFAFMKDTQEFKQIMVEQSNTMMEYNKQMMSEQNKIITDLVGKVGNTTINNTQNNTQFN